jgi:hypothetical protein
MENFPAPTRHRVLPWAANLCTLGVMVAATWWSSAQRPTAGAPALSSATQTVASEEHNQNLRQPAVAPAPAATQATWPAQTSSVQTETVKTVGYTASVLR